VLAIPILNARQSDGLAALDNLRRRLTPQGEIISPQSRALTERVFGEPLSPRAVVQRICDDVRERGDAALEYYSVELDRYDLARHGLRVPVNELAAAHAAVNPRLLQVVRRIRDRIAAYQSAILHHDVVVNAPWGARLTHRYRPLARAGLCVPGGAAAYPSTVLMTAVPAQAAGVSSLAVVAPPTPFGAFNRELLATCHELGITEVYRIGGAQGVAALAYGTATVPAVDKIVGPGNQFVALAKKYVYGQVAIDSIAGPSEVVVIADRSVPAAWVAADLIAQAEHSPASALLLTWDDQLVADVHRELEHQLATLVRSDLTRSSLEEYSALVRVQDPDQAVQLTDEIAPEHLHIQCRDADGLANRIRNAGATFVGPFSPVAVGDYAAGPSHVLPTGGTARWAAGLSSNDFLRSSSLLELEQSGLEAIAEDVTMLAEVEGLTGHAQSVTCRVGTAQPPGGSRQPPGG